MDQSSVLQREREDIHTISVLVSNKPGVLLRICLIFSRRAFNIESLVVSPAIDGRYSRMTITAQGSQKVLEQIVKQVDKLVDVLHASEHHSEESIEIELALIKIKANKTERTDILQIVDHFKATTVDFSDESLIIQVTGKTAKLDACLELFRKFEVLECVRTGKVAMCRGGIAT